MNWVDWIWEIIRAPFAFFALIWLVMLFGIGVFLLWSLTFKILQALCRRHRKKKLRITIEA